MKRNIQEIIETIATNISQNRYWYYSKKPMPCDLDDDFHDLIGLFSQALHTEREAMLKRIDSNTADALMAFSKRMAVWGARQNSTEHNSHDQLHPSHGAAVTMTSFADNRGERDDPLNLTRVAAVRGGRSLNRRSAVHSDVEWRALRSTHH